jgi:hypothetical protein
MYTPKKPFKLGNVRPQGIEVLDANDDPVMLVYGETQAEARNIAESVIRAVNKDAS